MPSFPTTVREEFANCFLHTLREAGHTHSEETAKSGMLMSAVCPQRERPKIYQSDPKALICVSALPTGLHTSR